MTIEVFYPSLFNDICSPTHIVRSASTIRAEGKHKLCCKLTHHK